MFIFSNLAITLDGKIATRSRKSLLLGTPEDRRQMKVLRQRCDAVLIGASTLRAHKRPCLAFEKDRPPINVIMSSSLEGVSSKWKFFQDPRLHRILFVDSIAPSKNLNRFSRTSEIIPLKMNSRRNSVAEQIIRELEKKGVKRLLVEGGGEVMWQFSSKNLIDEYHVTLTPKILGGRDAPTLVDGIGFSEHDILNLKLLQCRTVGDELYLVYRKR